MAVNMVLAKARFKWFSYKRAVPNLVNLTYCREVGLLIIKLSTTE